MDIQDYETLVCGVDGIGTRPLITRVLQEAKEEKGTIRIEIRSQPTGIPQTYQEHNVKVDPETATVESVMQALIGRLNESPGEQFSGVIRINFFKASGSEKYGTFSSRIQCGFYTDNNGQPPPSSHYGNPMPPRSSFDSSNSNDEVPDFGGGGEVDDDPNRARGHASGLAGVMMAPMMAPQGGMVTDQQARAWIETLMNLNFRQQSQGIIILERVIRMQENIIMRFGVDNPHQMRHTGISDIGPSGNTKPAAPEGLGLLPSLLAAAAQIAGAGTPTEAAKEAVSLATGATPKYGAARAMAVRGATELVRRAGGEGSGARESAARDVRRAPPPEMAPQSEFNEPSPDFGGGDGDGQFFEQEIEAAAQNAVDDERVQMATAPFDPASLSTDQMKEAFLTWIKADPSRKDEVMAMVPTLLSEINK